MAKFTDSKGKSIEFETKNVDKIYSGKPHECMCGCSGTYYANRENINFIKRVIKKFETFEGEIDNNIDEDTIFTIITSPTRQYTIYLKN